MQCPVCDDKMNEVERSGVMVDICPSCKGIWLDRGELDKLISLSEAPEHSAEFDRAAPPRDDLPREDEYRHSRQDDRERLKETFRAPQKRKGSWLAEILEGIGGD
ncbi:MAG: zf-TFIIB domain-containing protein [Armatimonadia bacterium]